MMTGIPASRDGYVGQIRVGVGEAVRQNQEIMNIESPELNTLVLAPETGVVDRLDVKPGDRVKAGQILAWVKQKAEH